MIHFTVYQGLRCILNQLRKTIFIGDSYIYIYILMDSKNAILTSHFIFQKTVECNLSLLR